MAGCRPITDPFGPWPPLSLPNDPLHRPPPPAAYGLRGPQIEPAASYWLLCPAPCVPRITDITAITDNPRSPCFFPPYPDEATTIREVAELKELACLRDDPEALFSDEPRQQRLGLSMFLRLRQQPLGAVVNTLRRGDSLLPMGGPEMRRLAIDACAQPRPDMGLTPCSTDCVDEFFPVIRTGRELARYFESETPGLAHRLALNYLIRDANLSPPYQALIWAALDVAIYSALSAAWCYKWLADADCDTPCGRFGRRPGRTSRRPRPYEVDYEVDVLYNREVNCTGSGDGERRTLPAPSPGTPRHPSYPSGHSTYAGAGSEILSYFFPDYAGEFTKLADNTGMARLWAGIHYRSDHLAGIRLGRCVARLIIRQIEESCVVRPDPCDLATASGAECKSGPPSLGELCRCAQEFCECCRRRHEGDPIHRAVLGGEGDEGREATEGGEGGGGRRGRRSRGGESGQEEPEEGKRGGPAASSDDLAEQARGPQEGAPPVGSQEGQREQGRGPQQGAPPTGSQRATRKQARGPQEGAS